ncbi:hypothetical protein TWF730_002748 [Orbilia blumenaviensis]|uniref:Uncharacterized protein n=1 Tax=Orbilia blumenaviensis TaxID=1796055 RepID=A0AAV9UBI7_9PEZI
MSSRKVRVISPDKHDLTGLNVLITGGNRGIGWEMARLYLTLGADTIYLAVRDLKKGKEARYALLADQVVRHRNPMADVILYEVDLSNLDSVVSFCNKFCSEVKVLHIAVLNAAIDLPYYRFTSDGMEESFQVNFFSNAILANYLVPLLMLNRPERRKFTGRQGRKLAKGSHFETMPSHLTWVVSTMNRNSGITQDGLIDPRDSIFAWFRNKNNMSSNRFEETKFLATAYILELGRFVDRNYLIVNTASPGHVRSGRHNNFPFLLRRLWSVFDFLFARRTAEGATAIIWATLSGSNKNATYWSNGMPSRPARLLHETEGKIFRTHLWDETKIQIRRLDKEIPVIRSLSGGAG